MSLIFAMISEFSARSASAVGLSWEQQVGIHRKFERGALQPIFVMLVQTLQSSIGPQRKSVSLIGKCLANLVSVLDWEFDEDIVSSKLSWASIDRTSSIAISASSTVRPGSAWTALLVASDLVEFMSSLQARLDPSDQSSAALARRCLIQLASIQGSVFPDTSSKCRYLARLMAGTRCIVAIQPLLYLYLFFTEPCSRVLIISAIPTIDATGASESVDIFNRRVAQCLQTQPESLVGIFGDCALDTCQFVATIFANFGTVTLISASRSDQSLPPSGPACELEGRVLSLTGSLFSFTENVIRSLGIFQVCEESRAFETLDVLLGLWSELSTQQSKFKQKNPQVELGILTAVPHYCTMLFQAFLSLVLVCNEPKHFSLLIDPLERLEVLSILARASVSTSLDCVRGQLLETLAAWSSKVFHAHRYLAASNHGLAALCTRIAAIFPHVATSSVSNHKSDGECPRKLAFLMHICGYLLVDTCSNDAPTIPRPLLMASAVLSAAQAELNPIISLIQLVHLFAELLHMYLASAAAPANSISSSSIHQHVSATLLESVSWYMSRWAPAYLFPDPSTCDVVAPQILQFFGPGAQSLSYLDFVIGFAQLCVFAIPRDLLTADPGASSHDNNGSKNTSDVFIEHATSSISLLTGSKQIQAHLYSLASWNRLVSIIGDYAASVQSCAPNPPLSVQVTSLLLQATTVAACECPASSDANRQERFVIATSKMAHSLHSMLSHCIGAESVTADSLQQVSDFFPRQHFNHLMHTVFYLNFSFLLILLHGLQISSRLCQFRGICRAQGAKCLDRKFGLIAPFFDPFLALVQRSSALVVDPGAVCSTVGQVIGIFLDLATSEMAYLDAAQSLAFMRASVSLVQVCN